MVDLTQATLSNPEKYTLLVVDDNQTNIRVIMNYLRDFGFKLLMAKDGFMALKVAKTRQPDLILLDVMMPELDGFETCQRLKADEITRHIPIIFMTALASEEDKVRGFEAGAVDYVTKPIQQREVLARVNTHLRLMAALREQEHQRKISDSLRNISKNLNSTLDQTQLLRVIMEQLGRVIPFDGASIFLYDGQHLVLSQGIGFGATYVGTRVAVTGKGSGVMVFNNQKPLLIADTHHDERWSRWQDDDPILSWMGMPLVINEECLGILTVDSFTANKYSEADIAVLQVFANHAAIAIRNASLYSLTQEVNKQLVQLNADKDRFFSIVAHDLKGPFMPLLGNAELLAEMGEALAPQQVKEMGQSIYRSARNSFVLLENLLQWARLQMGRMDYAPHRLDLAEVAAKNVDLLSDNAAIKQITLRSTIKTATWVYADENMLDTVIRNLVNNALKFTPQGGQVTIAASEPDPSSHPAAYLTVAVIDTGVGMSQETQQKLFKLDHQVTTSGTAKETGTGLGLIICHEMVARSGGRIWVESAINQGTQVKFTVRLDAP